MLRPCLFKESQPGPLPSREAGGTLARLIGCLDGKNKIEHTQKAVPWMNKFPAGNLNSELAVADFCGLCHLWVRFIVGGCSPLKTQVVPPLVLRQNLYEAPSLRHLLFIFFLYSRFLLCKRKCLIRNGWL